MAQEVHSAHCLSVKLDDLQQSMASAAASTSMQQSIAHMNKFDRDSGCSVTVKCERTCLFDAFVALLKAGQADKSACLATVTTPAAVIAMRQSFAVGTNDTANTTRQCIAATAASVFVSGTVISTGTLLTQQAYHAKVTGLSLFSGGIQLHCLWELPNVFQLLLLATLLILGCSFGTLASVWLSECFATVCLRLVLLMRIAGSSI